MDPGDVRVGQPRRPVEVSAADVALWSHLDHAEDIAVERGQRMPVRAGDVDMPEPGAFDRSHLRTSRPREGRGHERLGLLDESAEVVLAEEALRVDLVDVLRARRAGGEPAVVGRDLEPADRRAVAGRGREDGRDRLAGERVAVTASGDSFARTAFCAGVAGASMRR